MKLTNMNIVEINGWAKIRVDVSWKNNEAQEVFFAVPVQFMDKLDVEWADNFVIGLMLLAIKNGEDIIVENAKVSKTLRENLEKHLFPIFEKMNCGSNNTQIICDCKSEHDQIRGQTVATGISLGVDSFYSILKYQDVKENPINCVLYIKQVTGTTCILDSRQKYEINKRKEVASQLGIEYIPILSNLRSIVDSEFVFSQYHTFAHLSAAITIKTISCYYYATGFSKKEMQLNFSDTAYYDNYIQNIVCHKFFIMRMAGSDVSRFQKTELIQDNQIVQNYLEVCLEPKFEENVNHVELRSQNCTRCHKCNRTLATLDVLNSISHFSSVFDTHYYKVNRWRVWGEIEYRRLVMKDEFSVEILNKAKEKKLNIPKTRWVYFIFIGIRNQYNKIKIGENRNT